METPPPSPVDARSSAPRQGNPWTLPLVLAVGLAVAAWLLMAVRDDSDAPGGGASLAGAIESWSPPTDANETVALEIDFGNGARREFAALPYREGMTVGDALELAREFAPGIEYASQGEGDLSFLTAIDGVANQGAGGRTWLYKVGNRTAEVSYAVQPLAAGERVLWQFKEPE